MALGETTNKTYYTIGYGRIRRKCDKDTPNAIERENKDKEKMYALEYNFVEGELENITFKDDPKFGKSWTLHIKDAEIHYAVQMPEASRYATDLLKKIPRLHKGSNYKFTPYDFEDLNAKKRRVGLSIKTPQDIKLDSYYQKFTESGEKTTCENLHGYPEYDGDTKDKDELKIYFMRVTKFLRTKALEYIGSEFQNPESIIDEPAHIPESPLVDDEKADDLPF